MGNLKRYPIFVSWSKKVPSVLWREYHKNNEVTHDSHLLAVYDC